MRPRDPADVQTMLDAFGTVGAKADNKIQALFRKILAEPGQGGLPDQTIAAMRQALEDAPGSRNQVDSVTLTPSQMRNARILLGWSRGRLGAMSGTSAHFVKAYETTGRVIDAPPRTLAADRLASVRAALEAAGVVFIDEDGPGVRMQQRQI